MATRKHAYILLSRAGRRRVNDTNCGDKQSSIQSRPKLRRDIRLVGDFADHDGELWPVIKDVLLRGPEHRGFTLSREAVQIAVLLNGRRNLQEVARLASRHLRRSVTAEHVAVLAHELARQGFLVSPEISEKIAAKQQAVTAQGVHRHEWLFKDVRSFEERVRRALLKDPPYIRRRLLCVRGIAAPHADCDTSLEIAAKAYMLPDVQTNTMVVVLGPNHVCNWYSRAVVTGLDFDVPGGRVLTHTELVDTLTSKYPYMFVRDDLIHARDHAVAMQLVFIARMLPPSIQVLPILIGNEPHWTVFRSPVNMCRIAEVLTRELGRRDVWWVVSGDLLHFFGANQHMPEASVTKDIALYALHQDRRLLAWLDRGWLAPYHYVRRWRNDCLYPPLLVTWLAARIRRAMILAYGQSPGVAQTGRGTTYAALVLEGRE